MHSQRKSHRLRKEGDSNPRYGNPYGSLANCWFQPLTHPSKGLRSQKPWGYLLDCGCKGTTIFSTLQIFSLFFFVFSQFSPFFLSGIRDSNPRPSAWEANALPTELIPQKPQTGHQKKKKSQNWKVLTLFLEIERADSRTRTGDPRITNALLYQLSHIGNFSMISCSKAVQR